VIASEEGIGMAGEALIQISRDEVERARQLSELKYELDTQSKLADARQEGREEAAAEYAEQIRQLQEEIRRLRGDPVAGAP
jgi:hypothetical protein